MEQENTIPKLTQKDFEDPTLYRVNSIIGDMSERVARASSEVAAVGRQVVSLQGGGGGASSAPVIPGDSGGGTSSDAPSQPQSGDWALPTPTVSDYRADKVGNQFVRLRPSLVSMPPGADFVEFWLYKSATAPTDDSLWEYIGTAQADGEECENWQPQPTAAETWIVAATASKSTYRVLPDSTSDTKTVSISAWTVVKQLLTCSLTLEPFDYYGQGRYRIKVVWTRDTNDNNFQATRAAMNWCDSSFTPLAGSDGEFKDVVGSYTSPMWIGSDQGFDLPSPADGTQYRQVLVYPIGHDNVPNLTSPFVFNTTLSPDGGFNAAAIDPSTLGSGVTISGGKLVGTVRGGILNSDLEHWDSTTQPKDWTVEGTAGKVTRETTQKYSGTYSAKISADGVANNAIQQNVAVYPGKVLRIGAWLYNNTGAGITNISVVNFFDSSGTLVSSIGSSGSFGAGSWMESVITTTVPATAAYANIYPAVVWSTVGSGAVYVDQVTLTILEPIVGSSPIARSSTGIDLTLEGTEFYVVGGKLTQKGVDFSKAIVGTYNGSEFEIVSGAMRVKALAADKINTGILSVGGPSQVSKFAVFDTSGNAIGWIGDDSGSSGYVGAWFKQVRIGGTTPAGAKIAADTSGNVAIVGATFTLSKGVTYGAVNYTIVTTINPAAENNYTVGFKVEDASGSGVGNNGAGVYIAPNSIYMKRATATSVTESVLLSNRWDIGYGGTSSVSIQGGTSGAGVILLDFAGTGGAGNSYILIGGNIVLKGRQSAPTSPGSSSTLPLQSSSIYTGLTAGASYTSTEQGIINTLVSSVVYLLDWGADIKTQYNALLTAYNSLLTKLNTSGHGLIS